jgi:carbon monoxide dehydrogenase subunit G
MAAAPVFFVRTESVPSSGPSAYLPAGIATPQAYNAGLARIHPSDHKDGSMAVELDHSFTTSRSLDDSYATIVDLERVVPCVEGATVLERTGPDSVKAEIKVKMGAMSMTFTGTVETTEQDAAAHRAVLTVKSREAGGQGFANGTIVFALHDGGGDFHTNAQITGKAASMGEGVVSGVLDALITDFAGKLGQL